MELSPTNFIRIDGSTVRVFADSVPELRLAIKALKLKKKEYALLKRAVNERMKQVRADYTRGVRGRRSMMRGGRGFGRFVRAMQTVSRDSKRAELANDLGPYENQKEDVEAVLRAIDSAILQVEAHVLKNGG